MNQIEQFLATLAGDIGAASKVPVLATTVTADPAANAEVASLVVPAGELWEPILYTVNLVQGATQTPWPALVIDDGTNVLAQILSGTAAQSASVTTRHTWGRGMIVAGSAGGAASQGSLPAGLLLPAGYRLRTLTGGIGANTDYGVARLTYKKWS